MTMDKAKVEKIAREVVGAGMAKRKEMYEGEWHFDTEGLHHFADCVLTAIVDELNVSHERVLHKYSESKGEK